MEYGFIGVVVLILAWTLAWRAGSARTRQELRQLQVASAPADCVFQPAELADLDLPPLVEQYLARALPASARWPHLIRVRQTGVFRLGPGKPWLPFQAEQYCTLNPPGFVWQARIKMAPGLWLTARDSYLEGQGSFRGQLWGVIPLVRGVGREVDISSLLRYLSETLWFPFALTPQNGCRWEEAGPGAARVILADSGLEVSGVFSFNATGDITRFFTTERYRDQKGGPVRTDWSAVYADYQTFQGMRIPVRGAAIWHLPEGPLPYVRLRVTGVEFTSAG
jgi:hypothetical protein